METLLYSFFAGISTVLGAVIILVFGRPGPKLLSALLGFAGGVMLSLALFDLMPEALEQGSMLIAAVGFVLGAGIMHGLDRFIPHAHVSSNHQAAFENVPEATESRQEILRVGYLVFFGLALHNVPEGLAIGAGLEASPVLGLYIAIAIALHNVPEGIAAAGILRAGGLSKARVLLLTLIIGLMTPLGAGLGLIFFRISPLFIAIGMAFAAGAMVYIVSDELIPQSNKLNSHVSIGGFILGLMLVFIMTA
ncbi:MAG: ZIP family metal transporter [Dehalococcoidia bacterium]|nr:ZIP family metal transporter [Dehalococcoidia bacterium]